MKALSAFDGRGYEKPPRGGGSLLVKIRNCLRLLGLFVLQPELCHIADNLKVPPVGPLLRRR